MKEQRREEVDEWEFIEPREDREGQVTPLSHTR